MVAIIIIIVIRKRFNEGAELFEFYGDIKEGIHDNAPEALGKGVYITGYVDADHGGDQLACLSHTRTLIFVNSTPIVWDSTRQDTIKSSTFGSEVFVLRTALDILKGIRYNLQMMGVPINGPAYMFGDNKSVVSGAPILQYNISKKHLEICYCAIQEASSAVIWRVGFVKGKYNITDCLTKILLGTVKYK